MNLPLQNAYVKVTKKVDITKSYNIDFLISETKESSKEKIKSDFDGIYNSDTQAESNEKKEEFIEKWKDREPDAVNSLKHHFNYTITFLKLDKNIQKRIRTNNPVERFNEVIRRRTIPMRYFQNLKSFDRLVFGIISVLNINICYGIYQRANSYFSPILKT